MTKIYSLLTAFMLLVGSLSAQTVQIGTGTNASSSTLYSPVYRFSASSTTTGALSDIIFTQAELAAAGLPANVSITSIAFNKKNAANFLIPATFKVYMGNSNNAPPLLPTTTWASIVASQSLVYSSTTFNMPLAAGWVPINITPFTYTGGALEIGTYLTMTGGSTGATANFQWEYTPGFSTYIIGAASATSATLNGAVSTYTERPNIQITYVPLPACVNPPTPGIATSSATGIVCPGSNVNLALTGNTLATGLSIEWERSVSNSPFTPVSVAPASGVAAITIQPTATAWYRAKVSCSGNTPVYSTPVQVQVAPGLAAGNYSINGTLPTSGTNFHSFTDAISAMSCGIAGPVVFNVTPGSGPYVETVSIGNILNANANNTVRFKGNGATVQFMNTTTNRALLTLDGSRYITFDSIKFKSLDADYAYGAFITNNAMNDSIVRCTFDLSSVTGTSSTAASGIVFSASNTSVTTAGANGKKCYIGYNNILCTTGAGGPYYAISIAGASDSNIIDHNLIQNFYNYGIRVSDAFGTIIKNNELTRSTKTQTTSFYGIYVLGDIPGTVISGNKIHTPILNSTTGTGTFYGIYSGGAGTAINPVNIFNNQIYNLNQGGVLRGIYGSSSLYTNVYHNTISVDRVLTGTSAITGLYFLGTNTGLNIKNNIVSITAGAGGDKFGFYYTDAASVGNAQKNDFYINSTQPGTQYYGYDAANYATRAAFTAAFPSLEIGSPTVDPQFVNAASGNLMPQNFVISNAGENLNAFVGTDCMNALRTTTPTLGAYEMPLPPGNNGGMVALVAPSLSVCSGTYPLSVSIVNSGSNIINTMQVNWSVNGVLQTPYSYTGPLYSVLNPQLQSVDTVTIGNVTLNSYAPANIIVWTSLPNGVADANTNNDTLIASLSASMSGTYTIDASLPAANGNYQTFTAFSNDLSLKGICGPVTANVNAAAGPYTEFVKFATVPGSSAVNTIKINGNGALVQYATSAANPVLLTLSGSKYVKIDSLKFKATSSTYGWGAWITNASAYDSITRCVFDLTQVTSTASANSNGICFSSSSTSATGAATNGVHCYIGYNKILGTTQAGGYYYGITVCGASDSNVIANNDLSNQYTYGIYVGTATGTQVLNNRLHRETKTAVSSFYGIYLTGTAPGTKVVGNILHSPGGTVSPASVSSFYGIYATADGAASNKILIANNLIYNVNQGGTVYGVYGSGAVQTDIIHNTVDFAAMLSSTSVASMYGIYVSGTTNIATTVKNNIVTITGGNGGSKYGCYYLSSNSVAAAERNNFYVNTTQPGNQYYGYNATAFTTLAAFQTGNPTFETGSVSVNPQYANIATGLFLPLNTAMNANGSNQTALVSKDILGVVRAAASTPGAFETAPLYFNNAGATALINPSGTFCSGPRPVQVSIQNKGINNLDSVYIHWTVNNIAQTPYHYSGTLNNIFSSNNTTTLNIGTANFPAGQTSVVKAWTVKPNGVTDSDPSNDTMVATVTPSYSVMVHLGNDTAVCEGMSVPLNAGHPGTSYLWNTGATTQNIIASNAGPYYVSVTDADGCVGTDTMQLTLNAIPVINLGNDTFVCPDVVLNLDAGNAGAVYLWNDGSANQTLNAVNAGTYAVTVTAHGCSNSDAINVSHIAAPSMDGINATYSNDATYIFYPLNPLFTSGYTWNFGDGSAEETGYQVMHTYAHNGIYTVTCKMSGLCDSTLVPTARTVDVFDAQGGTGIQEHAMDASWNVYPNPAKESIMVEHKSGKMMMQVEIYSITGQLLIDQKVDAAKATIHISSLASGMYLLKTQTRDGQYLIKKIEISQ